MLSGCLSITIHDCYGNIWGMIIEVWKEHLDYYLYCQYIMLSLLHDKKYFKIYIKKHQSNWLKQANFFSIITVYSLWFLFLSENINGGLGMLCLFFFLKDDTHLKIFRFLKWVRFCENNESLLNFSLLKKLKEHKNKGWFISA